MRPQDGEPWVVWLDMEKLGRRYFTGACAECETLEAGLAAFHDARSPHVACAMPQHVAEITALVAEPIFPSMGCGPLRTEIDRYTASERLN